MNRDAPVAQLDRALPSEGKGHTFESCRVRQGFGGICGIGQNRFHPGVTGGWREPNADRAPHPTFRANENRDQQKAKPMSERLETLKKARERMVEDRDAFARTLAAPFDRDKAERARLKFIETQAVIDAIDRAIDGEPA
jgi:hypothetical protein